MQFNYLPSAAKDEIPTDLKIDHFIIGLMYLIHGMKLLV
jgi:hypothetical protein